VPYRIDVPDASDRAFERLVDLGALDIEVLGEGILAAVMPDRVTAQQVEAALGIQSLAIRPAEGRDDGSTWILRPRPIQVGRLQILPADRDGGPGVLRLNDTPAFGTGVHPTTALCLEWLDDTLQRRVPEGVLDIGTGSGVLALGALTLGVARAVGTDVDDDALVAATANARLNGLEERLVLVHGGPEAVSGVWPVVLANILAASLVEIAPVLVRRVGHHGHVVLSGMTDSVAPEVERAYRRLGMRQVDLRSRGGWAALVLQASW
jgi:ribosomal protein L11 methyltransferase